MNSFFGGSMVRRMAQRNQSKLSSRVLRCSSSSISMPQRNQALSYNRSTRLELVNISSRSTMENSKRVASSSQHSYVEEKNIMNSPKRSQIYSLTLIMYLITLYYQIGQIYFWVKSSNPALFKEALENFINESLDLMMTFVPEE